jgi:hypothetical protein
VSEYVCAYTVMSPVFWTTVRFDEAVFREKGPFEVVAVAAVWVTSMVVPSFPSDPERAAFWFKTMETMGAKTIPTITRTDIKIFNFLPAIRRASPWRRGLLPNSGSITVLIAHFHMPRA